MSKPLVSVVIPTRCRDSHLREAVGSVLTQKDLEMEIIVVDNASSVTTQGLCEELAVRYLRQERQGASAARNLGVSHASGELLAFLDDDDLWTTGSLGARLQEWQRHPFDTLVVGRARRFMEADGNVCFLDSVEEARHLLLPGASLMTRDAFLRCGGFDETITCHEDTDLWIRFKASGGKISYIPEICLHYRRHEGNITAAWNEYNSHITGVLRKHLASKRPLPSEARSADALPDLP
jgi:glycosyltransferase involved in cell wall biosynthesis